MSLDAVFVESVLEDLVVLDKFVLMFCIPLHFAEAKGAGVQAVHHGAVDCPSGTLLDLGQIELLTAPIRL